MSMFFDKRNPLANKTPYRRVVGKFPTSTLNNQGISMPKNMIYSNSEFIGGIESIADGDNNLQINIQTVNGGYTIQESDALILVDASSNPVTLQISAPTVDLKEYDIKIVDFTNPVSITANGCTIDSLGTYNFNSEDMSITLKSYNGNYYVT